MSTSGPGVSAEVRYLGPMQERPRYHANDSTRDVLELESRRIEIANARLCIAAPELEEEGFQLRSHHSSLADFADERAVASRYVKEVDRLLLELSGADAVAVNPRGVLRFSERSSACGRLDNSHPARFVHVDVSDATAAIKSCENCLPKAAPTCASARTGPSRSSRARREACSVVCGGSATTTSGAGTPLRHRTCRWRSAMHAAYTRQTSCPRTRSSTHRACRNGRSKVWWSRGTRVIAGGISRTWSGTRCWCSRPTTPIRRDRTACRTSRSTIRRVRRT